MKSSSQVEQRGQGGADELLVVGEEERIVTLTRPHRGGRPAATRSAGSVRPRGSLRRRQLVLSSPVSPLPELCMAPTPSSAISTDEGEIVTRQALACE